jgi:hypothetical protein
MRTKLYLTMLALLFGASCSERHAEGKACTPPLTEWGKPHPHLGPGVMMITVGLDHGGRTYFNGKALPLNELSTMLKHAGALENPEPVVILETEMGAPCATLDKVRALMNERLACGKVGHCDEGMQTVWRDLPYTGVGVP